FFGFEIRIRINTHYAHIGIDEFLGNGREAVALPPRASNISGFRCLIIEPEAEQGIGISFVSIYSESFVAHTTRNSQLIKKLFISLKVSRKVVPCFTAEERFGKSAGRRNHIIVTYQAAHNIQFNGQKHSLIL